MHHVNEVSYPLRRGHVFFLTPADLHGITVPVDGMLELFNVIFSDHLIEQELRQLLFQKDDSFRFPPSLLTVTVLSSALQAGQRVQLHYRSLQGDVTRRGFDPYGVVSRDGIWYTIGYCHLRQGQRLFRLDRIVQVEMAHEKICPGWRKSLLAWACLLLSISLRNYVL